MATDCGTLPHLALFKSAAVLGCKAFSASVEMLITRTIMNYAKGHYEVISSFFDNLSLDISVIYETSHSTSSKSSSHAPSS